MKIDIISVIHSVHIVQQPPTKKYIEYPFNVCDDAPRARLGDEERLRFREGLRGGVKLQGGRGDKLLQESIIRMRFCFT